VPNVAAEDCVEVTFEGVVLAPDGAPADEAVVVSSAGGQVVADSDGAFRLDVQVAVGAGAVQLTAVAGGGGRLLASKRVPVPAVPGPVRVGSLQLARSSSCSPSWLPTFGGQPGTSNEVKALLVFDDGGGPALYAGGYFKSAGGVAVNYIARWDGSSWTPLGSGLGQSGVVNSLAVFDDGGGPALYVGGGFLSPGGGPGNNIAKWDGSGWSPLGTGMDSWVDAMTVFDDGGGPALYAGGGFTSAGGVTVNHIAKWDGSSWAPLGTGTDKSVYALAVFDDGSGPALHAAGGFLSAGGGTANHIAKWDGSSWSPLGSGIGGGTPTTSTL